MEFPPRPQLQPGIPGLAWGILLGAYVWIGLLAIGTPRERVPLRPGRRRAHLLPRSPVRRRPAPARLSGSWAHDDRLVLGGGDGAALVADVLRRHDRLPLEHAARAGRACRSRTRGRPRARRRALPGRRSGPRRRRRGRCRGSSLRPARPPRCRWDASRRGCPRPPRTSARTPGEDAGAERRRPPLRPAAQELREAETEARTGEDAHRRPVLTRRAEVEFVASQIRKPAAATPRSVVSPRTTGGLAQACSRSTVVSSATTVPSSLRLPNMLRFTSLGRFPREVVPARRAA